MIRRTKAEVLNDLSNKKRYGGTSLYLCLGLKLN